MNGLRNSIFNKALIQFEKNELTKKIIYFVIQIGLGDFVYRTFSKEYLKNRRKFYKENEDRIIQNINCLEDEISKKDYENLIRYRCFRRRTDFPKFVKEQQYFVNKIINLSENEIFVDCGAFTGDTAEIFIKNTNSNYKKIICFEPDRVNFEILNDNLKKYSNVNSYCLGVYSQKKKFAFNSKQNEGSLLDENGSDFIETIKLDDFDICKDATFIKMDVEGAELEALKGAEKIILNNKPKLAICIYHSDQDIIDIIEYIHKLRPDYKLYVRHHSLYEAETVLYCI